MRGLKAGALSTAIRVSQGTPGGTVGQRVQAAPVRGRRERASRCRHYLPLRRGRLHRVSCVVVRCPRRVMAVRVPWTLVQHSVGRVRAGVRRAQLCCVRGDARRRNLLDLKVWTLALSRGQPSAPALLSIYPSSRRSLLSSYGYTCDIFPFKSINTTFVSIDTWSTSYTSGFFLPTYSYFLSIYDPRMYHTYFSVHVVSPSHTLSFARAPSLIQLGDFSILLSLASSVVLVLFPCLVVSLFPSFPLLFFFSLFVSFSRLFCVHRYDGVKSNSLGLYSRKSNVVWETTLISLIFLSCVQSNMCELESPRPQARTTERSTDQVL